MVLWPLTAIVFRPHVIRILMDPTCSRLMIQELELEAEEMEAFLPPAMATTTNTMATVFTCNPPSDEDEDGLGSPRASVLWFLSTTEEQGGQQEHSDSDATTNDKQLNTKDKRSNDITTDTNTHSHYTDIESESSCEKEEGEDEEWFWIWA